MYSYPTKITSKNFVKRQIFTSFSLLAWPFLSMSAAQAADGYSYTENGWSLGVNLSRAVADLNIEALSSELQRANFDVLAVEKDRHSGGYKAYIGYQFTPYLGIEGGYFDLGQFGSRAVKGNEGALKTRTKTRGFNVDLVGGDTTSSRQGLVISVTSIGYADEKDIVYRNGAEEGDLICVSGDLGGAYVGLQLLEREKQIFLENPNIQPDLEGKDYIVERQLKPEARRDVVELFRHLNVKPNAMIDVSDGLASDLFHICDASKLGCKLYEEKIPIDPMTYETAREFGLDPTVCALSGGEDYELLFTVPQSEYDKVKNQLDISIIGYMTEESAGRQLISKSGNVHELKAQGWNAFS